MSKNKSYRIRLSEVENDYVSVNANLVQDYDSFEVLSLTINSSDTYKLHNANYGVVVGRVLANNGFGIPNAKISIFIEAQNGDNTDIKTIYPFSNTASKDKNGVRYNLLPDEKVSNCHQIVGTFPNKRYALDNDVILEVFDKYYKYTTRTNNAGDYIIMGVPTGTHTLHMDLDLSDCGILSQRPRDFVYKGYTIEQFENPNMFKDGTTYSNLSQVFTQDQVVNVQPFWGNSTLGETIGITKANIDIAFKFEPTCVFMGSIASDNASQGISKKCIPTPHMGDMDEMVAGEGTIEMIRKTPDGSVEEFQIKGTQLINANGVWCYQIPMNLDYMMTDEYGNMVPTDDPEKGIPTRASVRFRIGMQDAEANTDNYFRPKVLVPNNPQNLKNGAHENYDYEFGSKTSDESFRDLFWNNVYSVKSFIPRFQKRQITGWNEDKFTGIKHCNYYGPNNPIPYNNIRIKLPFMFVIMCAIFKCFVFLTGIINFLISGIGNILADIGNTGLDFWVLGIHIQLYPFKKLYEKANRLTLNVLRDGLCPDLENWYFAPMFTDNRWDPGKVPPGCDAYDILEQTLKMLRTEEGSSEIVKGRDDTKSIDYENSDANVKEDSMCLTIKTDYLISCIEMNLAQEYRVINFDFYNDWVNGFIYVPRFMRYIRPKIKFLGITLARAKVKGCMDDTSIFAQSRKYTQQCSLGYKKESINGKQIYSKTNKVESNTFHKKNGFKQRPIFGANGGVCHEQPTSKKQYVYYLKPCEWISDGSYNNIKVNLFATDIILLGSLNDCDLYGIPQAFKHLSSSSYIMPTNLALTNMDTNGPLYAKEDGTICDGGENDKVDIENAKNGSGVTTIDISTSGLSSEIDYYNGANERTQKYDTNYETQEPSDTIALTEAAGISWNWTGPGQGSVNKKKMYYPGGHFLGLSCVNSQTNIKSCINLDRICEIGATLSQRKEDVSGYKDGKLEYTYTVPTGFISGDEIIDTEFRTMFATMNRKRLIATKRNEENGYKTYDFSFLRPSNFDGAFKEVVGVGEPYNTKIDTVDESDKLAKYNIKNAAGRSDYDGTEVEKTQTRTKESTNIDYYMFRFGLNINDLSSGDEQERKFLKGDNGYRYMPQYENSYYFYFGMKFGATAIDEFNKEFFSNCGEQKLMVGQASVNAYCFTPLEELFANNKGDIKVSIFNMESPYNIECKRGNNIVETHIGVTSEEDSFNNLEFGDYIIIVTDANGVTYSKNVSVGTDLISYTAEIHDYNTLAEEDEVFYRGGYINLNRVNINGANIPNTVKICLVPQGETPTDWVEIHPMEDLENVILSGKSGDEGIENYELKIKISNSIITIGTITFKRPDNINLFIGFKNILSANVSSDEELQKETGWWHDGMNWLEKKCFFDNAYKTGETFNAHLFTENGEKALWGYAQGPNDEFKDYKIYKPNEIPTAGKVVDDEIIYWPVVDKNDHFSCQYSCMVINDTSVGCNYHGYSDKDKINHISDIDYNTYYGDRKPCGYIFKNLDQDIIEYRVLGNDYGQDDELKHDTEGRGVYYPTYTFPILKRPFSGVSNIFIWSDKSVVFEDSSTGEKIPTVLTSENGFGYNIKIKNGITDNGKFSDDSKIEYWTDKTNGSISISGERGTRDEDLEGLEYGNDKIRTRYGKTNNTINGLSTISSRIVEHFPNTVQEEDKDRANVLSLTSSFDVSSTFYDDIAFKLDDDNKFIFEDGKIVINGYGNTSVDSEYYICDDIGGKIIEDSKIAICHSRGTYIYVACKYNDYAEYDDTGVSTIATVSFTGEIKYKITTDDGITQETKTVMPDAGEELYNALIEGRDVKDLWPTVDFDSNFVEITPIYKKKVKDAIFNESDIIDTIERGIIKTQCSYITERVYYGIGKFTNEDGVLWKIYPYVTPLTKEKDLTTIKIDPKSPFNFGTEGGEIDINIISDRAWNVEKEEDWIELEPSTGDKGTTKANLKCKPNDNTPRLTTLDIVVKLSDGSKKKKGLKITQDGVKLLINPTSWSPASAATSTTLTITSNTSWVIIDAPLWISFDKDYGHGDDNVIVSVEANMEEVSRSAVIKVKANEVEVTYTVTQGAFDPGNVVYGNITTPAISYSNAPAAGGDVNVTLTAATQQWWYENKPSEKYDYSGITYSYSITNGTGANINASTGKLTWGENTSTSERSVNVKVIANGGGSKSANASTTAKQVGAASHYITVTPTSITFPAETGPAATGTVTSDVAWTATTSDTWLHLVDTTGGPGNANIRIAYDGNATTSVRTATITLTGNGASATISVTQEAAPKYVTVTGYPSGNVTDSGTTYNLTVSANTNWTLAKSSTDSWVTLSKTSGGSGKNTVTLTVGANTGSTTRTATITVGATDATPEPASFTVTQDGKAAPKYDKYYYNGSPASITVYNTPFGGNGKTIEASSFVKIEGETTKEGDAFTGTLSIVANSNTATTMGWELMRKIDDRTYAEVSPKQKGTIPLVSDVSGRIFEGNISVTIIDNNTSHTNEPYVLYFANGTT